MRITNDILELLMTSLESQEFAICLNPLMLRQLEKQVYEIF